MTFFRPLGSEVLDLTFLGARFMSGAVLISSPSLLIPNPKKCPFLQVGSAGESDLRHKGIELVGLSVRVSTLTTRPAATPG